MRRAKPGPKPRGALLIFYRLQSAPREAHRFSVRMAYLWFYQHRPTFTLGRVAVERGAHQTKRMAETPNFS